MDRVSAAGYGGVGSLALTGLITGASAVDRPTILQVGLMHFLLTYLADRMPPLLSVLHL